MMRQTLDAGLPALGLDLPENARQTLCDFGAAVIKQNEVMNLTAITQPDQVAKLHLLDSLTVLTAADLRGKHGEAWVTKMLVIPSFVTTLRSQSLNSERTLASIAANGSSRSSTCGLGANALAKATLCRCPPDNWFGYRFSIPESPVISKSSVTRFLISFFGTF